MAFYDHKASEVTLGATSILCWLKQSQAHLDLRGEAINPTVHWKECQKIKAMF